MEKNYTAAAKISYKCMEERAVLLTFVGQSTLRAAAPSVITYAEMDHALSILEHALEEYEAGISAIPFSNRSKAGKASCRTANFVSLSPLVTAD